MTARAFDVMTLVLPPDQSANPTLQPIQANASFFQLDSFPAITTLSSNLARLSPDQIQGLLYVPTLPQDDICVNLSAPYVPKNVTRRKDIPTTTYAAVGLAPWLSADCTKSYLKAAMQDSSFIRAIIFFLGNDTTAKQPPPISDPVWSLNDGGRWKSQIEFPAYALPGPMGNTLMQQLSLYSGNVSTLQGGMSLASDFGPGGMPRLYAAVVVDGGPSLPSLWVFLIIVLGILLAVVTGSSLFMGFVQRRRRQALRRRVERGEVDLEALGVKRMTVPQSQLDQMPLYTFRSDQVPTTEVSTSPNDKDQTLVKDSETTNTVSHDKSYISPNTPAPGSSRGTEQPRQHFSQTTCTICLDDYVSNETTVRELPCHHIFHPECVDPFLLEHSSACPMCKKSTLPDGFCPEQITNAMVRREQLIRRIQERRTSRDAIRTVSLARQQRQQPRQRSPQATIGRRIADLRTRLNIGIHHRHEAESQQPPAQQEAAPFEMTNISTTPAPPATLDVPTSTTTTTTNRASILALQSETDPIRRREIARQRAIANLDRQDAAVQQDIEQEQQRLPLWRRAVGRVFPALTA